jgi:WD40 repeat protein
MRSGTASVQPPGRIGRALTPGGFFAGSLIAAWFWFSAGPPRDGLLEARARVLPAEVELSFGPCAKTVPNGIRAFTNDRSTELAMPVALGSPLWVDFERHVIARRSPWGGQRDDLLMTSGDRVNPARIWDRADGRVMATFEGSADNDEAAVLSNDGTRVYIGSRPGDPGVWRIDGGAPLGMMRLDHYFAAKGATFTKDGNGVLLTGPLDPHDINTGALIAWTIARGEARVLARGCGINGVKLNDDDTQVTVGVSDCPGDHEEQFSTGFAPSAGASTALEAAARWDIGFSGEERQGLRPPDSWLARGLLSTDGKGLAVWSRFGSASVRDARTGTMLGAPRHGSEAASEPSISDVSFDAAGDRVAIGGAGGGAVFWDIVRRELVFDVTPGSSPFVPNTIYKRHWFRVVALSSDGTKALLGGAQGEGAIVWDITAGRRLYDIAARSTNFGGLIDGKTTDGGTTPRHPAVIAGPWMWEHVAGAAFSPDGSTLLVVDESARAHLLDAATGKFLRDFVHAGATGKLAFDLRYQSFWANGVALFSPDGRRVAVGGDLGPRLIFETETGGYVSTLDGADRIEQPHMMFNPDGTKIVSAEAEWDANSGAVLGIVRPAHPDTLIGGAGWTRDGRSVVATCEAVRAEPR